MKVATYSPAVALFLLTRRVQLGFAANASRERVLKMAERKIAHTHTSQLRDDIFLAEPSDALAPRPIIYFTWRRNKLLVILEIFGRHKIQPFDLRKDIENNSTTIFLI